MQHCFWIVGCFPYLGFFKEEKAYQFQQRLENQGHYTFKAPCARLFNTWLL